MIRPGDIVISKAGRDKGRPLIVLENIDENFVLLVDGDLRPLEKPKKKKLLHLQRTNKMTEKLDEARASKNNALLRKELQRLMPRKGS
ncbi:MAG: RNA-binding protein [Tissierellia bacterium]|jgi:ribosomal protein L14E/L6E/L27E|nr:RNA-binding protein [Tissierellia bacterium]